LGARVKFEAINTSVVIAIRLRRRSNLRIEIATSPPSSVAGPHDDSEGDYLKFCAHPLFQFKIENVDLQDVSNLTSMRLF